MKYALLKIAEMPVTIMFALILGIVLSTYLPGLREALLTVYDHYYPVVNYKSEIVGRSEDAVMVRVWGEKLRDCNVVPDSLDSFTVKGGMFYDAAEIRVQGYAANRPVGRVDLGIWKVWPTRLGDSVQMWVLHNCDGHIVRSKIVDVKL